MSFGTSKYKKIKKPVKLLWHILLLTVGALLYAMGVGMFIDPNNMAPGGLTGAAILLNRVLPVKTGTLIILFNIPLLAVATWRFKIKFALSTIYATLLSSKMIDWIMENKPFGLVPATEDMMLAALVGGVLIAVGLGLIFHGGGSSGGTDIIVKLLRQKYKHIKTGAIFFILDLAIVGASAFLFGLDRALYALLSVLVTSFMLDFVLYGKDGAKVVYIVSRTPKQISVRLLNELGMGATFLEGRGAYTGDEREILLCAFHKHLYPRVRDIVKDADADAFMIVTSAHEVFGEGFKNPFADEM